MKSVGAKLLFLISFLIGFILFAQTPFEVVKKDYKPAVKLVHDFGDMLNPVEEADLERQLVAYNDSTSVQVVVVTFQKLDGYPIHLLASEIGENWGVGQKDDHNGIVIVLSNEDRKVDIRTGYGAQIHLPPSIAKLIIDKEMIPQFRNGNYYQGLVNALDAIHLSLAGKYQAKPKSNQSSSDGWGVFIFFFVIILLFIFLSSKGGGGGGSGNRGRRGFNWGDVILTSGGTRSWGGGSSWGGGGSWGGGSSGGGFGGFGGGSFGGGGASGSW